MKFVNKKKVQPISLIKKMVDSTLEKDANDITCIFIYQPKTPKELKRFSKINKEWLVKYQKKLLLI